MAFIVKDRVKEQVAAPGTGAITCRGTSLPGYQNIGDVMADGDIGLFCVRDGRSNWQTFVGTWTAASKTLTRSIALDGNNGVGVTVNISADAEVWINNPASDHGLTFNIRAFGAVGDGVTDDSAAFQAALDAVPTEGGVVLIPPTDGGIYIVDACLRHKSYTTIRGSGAAATLKNSAAFSASADYGGSAMFLNKNSESAETAFTAYRDFGITFENVWIDITDNPAGSGGHAIFHRATQSVKIINCHFEGGGDGTAAVTCDDHLVIGCTAIDQKNCTYDHWGGSTNCRVVASYGRIHDDSTAQVVNFNAIRTSVGGGSSETWVSDGFTLMGCDLYSGTTQRSVNLEPLGTNSTVRNVRVEGNRFYNVRLVMGGNCHNVVITDNQWLDTDGSTAPIWSRVQTSDTPAHVQVIGNQFIDCDAASSGGLIDLVTPGAIVIGNSATGGTYDYGVYFRGTGNNVYLANSFPDYGTAETAGTWGTTVGDVVVMNNHYYGWRTTSGYVVKLEMGSDDNLILKSTGTAGASRNIWQIQSDSATAAFICSVNQRMSAGYFIPFQVSDLTATGTGTGDAYVLTSEVAHFGTVAAGTGARLPSVVNTGQRHTIVNEGANTLLVYPTTGAQIDALGANNPYSLLSGEAGIWQYLNAHWVTISVF